MNSVKYLREILDKGLQSSSSLIQRDSSAAPSSTSRPSRDASEAASHRSPLPQQGFEPLAHRPPRPERRRTVLTFAQPPPTTVHKRRLHIRPRVLVQLRCPSETSRHPVPVLDVIPYSPSNGLRHVLGRQQRSQLHLDDLIITRCEAEADKDNDDNNEQQSNETDSNGSKGSAVAVIQRSRRKDQPPLANATLTVSSDGRSWQCSRLAKGSYQFDDTTLSSGNKPCQPSVRWVPRSKTAKTSGRANSARRTIHSDDNTASARSSRMATTAADGFAFSIMDPGTSRHAVIARLNADGLQIYDTYYPPAPAPLVTQGSQNSQASDATLASSHAPPEHAAPSRAEHDQQQAITVTPALRDFIAATGILVALTEGYIPDVVTPHACSLDSSNPTSTSASTPAAGAPSVSRHASISSAVGSSSVTAGANKRQSSMSSVLASRRRPSSVPESQAVPPVALAQAQAHRRSTPLPVLAAGKK